METEEFKWSDGSSLDFTSFLPVEAFNSSNSERCMVLNQMGYWERDVCLNGAQGDGPNADDVVCEKPTSKIS